MVRCVEVIRPHYASIRAVSIYLVDDNMRVVHPAIIIQGSSGTQCKALPTIGFTTKVYTAHLTTVVALPVSRTTSARTSVLSGNSILDDCGELLSQ